MKKILSMTMVLLVLISFMGCSKEEAKTKDGYSKNLYVYNWGDYIDESVLDDFKKEYGIKVIYETFTTNEEMLAKIKMGGTDYDVIFPSEYMIEAMIREDLLLELDHSKLDQFKNIGDEFKNLEYDPNNKYSIPYFWGTMGIIYNKNKVDTKIDSWNDLWDERYKDDIIMIDSPRDTIGITLKKLGYSLNTRDKKELEEAKNALIEQKPLVKAYEVDNYKKMMIANEAAMSLAWSGDAMLLIDNNPDLEYIIPEEGTNLWFDSMAIPKTSKRKEEAQLFINYMLRPDVAKKCSEYVMYSTPNVEAIKLLPEEIRENNIAYPKGDIMKKGEVFIDLGEFTREYDRIWTEIKSK